MNTLLCFGIGYCAQALAQLLKGQDGWRIAGTSRTNEGAEAIARKGFEAIVFDGETASAALSTAISQTSHVLISAPPGSNGDPVLRCCAPALAGADKLRWLGYLSTIGVYGDSGGGWVDEETTPRPTQERAIRRLRAEAEWLEFGARGGKAVQIFRIAGIYGPGRNAIADLKAGAARCIIKPGQVFNRIHVADIALCLAAAMSKGQPGRIYNLTDNEPAAPEDVVRFAAQLLGIAPPLPVPFASAALSPMAASFYAGNRRVRNERIRRELGVALLYPTYREGLTSELA